MARKGKVSQNAKVSKRRANVINQEDLHEKIQKKAYERYKKRGFSHGSDWADWFEAERTVNSES